MAASSRLSEYLVGWFRKSPPSARRALLASCFGWMLDSFDVMLYALVLAHLMSDLSMSKTTAGLLGSLTLLASAFGGMIFGLVADRLGRTVALRASILIYSVFTFLCGLSQNVYQLGLFRTFLGLGMGGEWASGAALVSEYFPSEHRGKALGFMQSFWAVGYALAVLVTAVIMPWLGWRAVFFVGILPALLVFWIRSKVDEPELWKKARPGSLTNQSQLGGGTASRSPFQRSLRSLPPLLGRRLKPTPCDQGVIPPWNPRRSAPRGKPRPISADRQESKTESSRAATQGESPESKLIHKAGGSTEPKSKTIISGQLLQVTLAVTLMNALTMFAWWGFNLWIPGYLSLSQTQGGLGLSTRHMSSLMIFMQLGMWLGYLTFGYISDSLGRKKSYIFYLVSASLLVFLYSIARTPLLLFFLGPVVAFFGTGYFTGFGALTAELYPTRIRATLQGITYNSGRVVSAIAPLAIGSMAQEQGFRLAFWLVSGAFILAALSWSLIPETRGKELE